MKNIFAILYVLVAVVELYGADWCPYCRKAEMILKSKNIKYIKHDFGTNKSAMRSFLKTNGFEPYIPQIVIDGKKIGGYSDLESLSNSGQLDKMVAQK